ncbi:MAG: hypothetical protein J0H00_13915 [Burkholderiales bacterium]|nr:hypothetical protein [Burkholderiales bacterium]OJX05979.1 MAG: hypothetical protein BGO72_04830 [Burkholderiales bacterium 70-64]
MKISILMPRLGPNMHEATFVTWLKGVGDPVTQGEAIAEVMTDKVNIDVEAPATGVLAETLAVPDQVLPVDGVLGSVESGDCR